MTVSNDLCKQTQTDCLATVNGNHNAPAVGMAKELMTPLFSDEFETKLLKDLDETLRSNDREIAHAVTATLCTPTNSVEAGSST